MRLGFFTLLFIFSMPLRAKLPDPVLLLQEYLKIDTSNPPGNELKAAQFLAQIFNDHHIPAQVLKISDNRANIMAELKGDGTLAPIILLHHLDVVPADSKFWKHDPFGGTIENGFIYGRGSVDIKSKGIMDLMVMLKLKEEGKLLKRDIIFLGVADEEHNSDGTKWMIKNFKAKLSSAQFLIDEGGAVTTDEQGKIDHFSISLGEKSPLWITAKFKGTPGHGSVPHADNAAVRAVQGAQKILKLAHNEPFRIIPGTEDYLEHLLKNKYKKFPGFKENFISSLSSPVFLKAMAKDPEVNALIRNTITLTGLNGSDKINTIPNEAQIKLDCRLLPGTLKDDFIKKIQQALGEGVVLEVEEHYKASFTSPKSSFLNALKKTAGNAPVLQTLLVSSTDASFYRELGIEAFGFEAYPVAPSILNSSHANDERLPLNSLHSGTQILYDLLKNLEVTL